MAVPERIPYVQKVKIGFWKRQFGEIRTSGQLGYDIVFGLVLPVLCFLMDPVVFNNRFAREGFSSGISEFKTVTYCFSAIAIVSLSVSFFTGRRSPCLSALLGGVLLVGAIGSFAIGVLILPLSLPGILFMFIGLLGFIPFFTAFAYFRNARRSLREAKDGLDRTRWILAPVVGSLIVLGPSVLAHFGVKWAVTRLVDDAIRVDQQAVQTDIARLRPLAWAADLDPLLSAYTTQPESAQKELAAGYLALTGEDIRWRLRLLAD